MREMGRLGGLAQRAKVASQQAAAKVAQGLEEQGVAVTIPGLGSTSPPGAGEDETATAVDVDAEVGRLRQLLDAHRPAPGPVVDRWSIGIGDLIAQHPLVPQQLQGVIRKLNHYGGLAISEQGIAFDDDEIDWSSVTEIRTRNVVDYLLSDAVAQQISSLPVPWFPGRRRMLDATSKALMTVLAAAAQQQLDRPEAALRIPAEIHFRGTIRRNRELTPGVLAALALADPAINQCLLATAQSHGVLVTAASDETLETARARAAALRQRLGRTEDRAAQNKPTAGDEVGERSGAANPTGAHNLPDQGDLLIEWARVHGASRDVAALVASVRRPDGVLVSRDLSSYEALKDGPLHILKLMLNHQAMTFEIWVQVSLEHEKSMRRSTMSRDQRKVVTREAGRICDEQGVDAAKGWVVANVTERLDVDRLRHNLEDMWVSDRRGYYMQMSLEKALRKWRRG